MTSKHIYVIDEPAVRCGGAREIIAIRKYVTNPDWLWVVVGVGDV